MVTRAFIFLLGLVATSAYAVDPDVDACLAAGDAAAKERDMPKAIKWFSRALEKDPLCVDALNSRAVMYAHSGEVALALNDATRALQLDPKSVHAYFARAMAYRHRGDLDKAIEDLSAGIRLDPERWNLVSMRGEDYVRQGKFEEALADYNRAIELDPTRAINYVSRGDLHAMRGDYQAAYKDFEQAQRTDPDLPATYDAFSRLLATCPEAKLRDGKRALKYAQVAMKLNPNREEQWETLAAAYAAVGDFEKAIEWQQRYLDFKGVPEGARPYVQARLALYKLGQPYIAPPPSPRD